MKQINDYEYDRIQEALRLQNEEYQKKVCLLNTIDAIGSRLSNDRLKKLLEFEMTLRREQLKDDIAAMEAGELTDSGRELLEKYKRELEET